MAQPIAIPARSGALYGALYALKREKVRGARPGDIGGHRKKRRLHLHSSVHEAIAAQENE